MPIIVTCEACSMTHRVKESSACQRITCQGCGRKLIVTAPGVSPLSDHNTAENDEESSDTLTREDVRDLARQLAETPSPATTVQELPPLGKRLFGFAMNLLLLVVVGYFATVVAGSFREAWRSNSWPSVMGTVKSSSVQRTGVGKNARTVALVTYRYEVNSVNHTGDRICVEGYSKKIFESAQAVSDRYVVDQPVKVFYDPGNHASAVLLTGTTPGLWWPVIMLALLGSSIGYSSYASFRSLIGKPLPKRAQTGRSLFERAMAFFAFSMIVLMVGIMIFVVVGTRQNWHLPHGLGEWFMLFFLLLITALFLGFWGLAGFGMYCSFMPAAKLSDLRAEPGLPSYSEDSLICVGGNPGRVTAIIVDDRAGLIHFRKSFWPVGFWVIKAVPWFSCPLKKITSVSQMTYKGTTTLTIHTRGGSGSISSLATGFDELLRRFPKTKTEYAPGTSPLSGTQAVLIATGIIGLIAGMVLTIPSLALGLLVAIGSGALFVAAAFVKPGKDS